VEPSAYHTDFTVITAYVQAAAQDILVRAVVFVTSLLHSLRPLCSQIGHDVRDRQTYVRHAWLLNAPYPNGGETTYLNEIFYGVVFIVRDLGIYLDSSLTMTAHISRTVSNFSPQGHLLRTSYPIGKKHRYHRCISPCGETTYFPTRPSCTHE